VSLNVLGVLVGLKNIDNNGSWSGIVVVVVAVVVVVVVAIGDGGGFGCS
jgi:hypothetical protein